MHEELKKLSELTEVRNISFYGSHPRGNSDGTDIDTLVFTTGPRYNTPHVVYRYTAQLPIAYDVFTYNEQELRGVATGLFSPIFVEHLAEWCEPFYGKDLKKVFRDKTTIWRRASEELNISWGYFSELTDRIRHLRKGYEQLINFSPDPKTEKEVWKKEMNRSISAMRTAIRMKDIRLGRFDDKETVIKTYYENYVDSKDHENLALSTVNDDFSKMPFETALERIELWKEIGEEVLWAVDRGLCQELGL